MTKIIVRAIDDPDGTEYTLAPEWAARRIRQRFDDRHAVVLHPTEENVFIYHPENFWDGPTHVRWEPDTGHFSFGGWGGDQHFPLIGPIM